MEAPDVVTVRKCADTSYAKYLHSKNIIELHNIQEQQLQPLLIHELNHWAQHLLLDKEQSEQILTTYHKELKEGRLPFLESMFLDDLNIDSDQLECLSNVRKYYL